MPPLLGACQPCHPVAEAELAARVATIQDRHHALLERAAADAALGPSLALQGKAQWRLDLVAAENSMGFHAPQETARVLAESIDYTRQGQRAADRVTRR